MKHARADYQCIQDPLGRIPADEPVFLLRAQDSLASTVVAYWARLAREAGLARDIVEAAERHVVCMAAWSPKKPADLPPDPNAFDETFGQRLRSIRRDLARIVNAMNLDRSHDAAEKAQIAVSAVAQLEQELHQLGANEWPWNRKDVEPDDE